MKCPVCDVDLLMAERQGVEIDYCPKCRGVWLDRGELDKIIDRSNAEIGVAVAGPQPLEGRGGYDAPPARREVPIHSEPDDHRDRHHDHHGRDRDYGPSYDKPHKKKRSSFIGELFEGFGD
ncbi:MAG: zf-TFIIB domain-containing protein [Actinobacteria bacterium]|nr:zf-TFIIB domain-containing protein [Actinomycetota bacterium]